MALGDWVKSLTRLFKSRVSTAKHKMVHHRGKYDREHLRAFEAARGQYINLLNQRETFWKQRAKQFWLVEGDSNTRFFHSMATVRRKKNHIS